jgi:hypothetical protein
MAWGLIGRRFKAGISPPTTTATGGNEALDIIDEIRKHGTGIRQTHYRTQRHTNNRIAAIAPLLITATTVLAAFCRIALPVAEVQQGTEVAIHL